MKFRTEIQVPSYPFKISHTNTLFLVGSCFSDHFGNFFTRYQFNACSNPFGTLFNPISIAHALQMAMEPGLFTDKYIDFFNDRWISYAHHGRFSHADKAFFEKKIKDSLDIARNYLLQSDYLFITMGTAYCYRLTERNLVVANCHKIPAAKFEKFRLSVNEVVEVYRDLCKKLFSFSPKLKIIFTVSPVRHLGDGFHENQLSKSILHLAVEELLDDEKCFYFPAFEILQDDLRDYRFYAADLVHPAESAVTYIREKLSASIFSEDTVKHIEKLEKLLKAQEHIPLQK